MGSKPYKMDRVGLVFPGQASQYVGMGQDFFSEIEQCKDILAKGEELTGLPLTEKITSGPIEELTRTLICQPAVFATSLVCWEALKKKLDFIPFAVGGHSLGEYTALVVSGTITMEDAFIIVKKRAEIMDEISGQVDGALLAVIGEPIDVVESMVKKFEGIEIANINSPSQIVIGGSKNNLQKIYAYLRKNKIKAVFLKVSGPFHTSLMKEAGKKLACELDKIEFQNPQIPLYVNALGTRVSDKETVRDALIKQLYSPVKWIDNITNMKADGTNVFLEVGPKNVLKKLLEKIIPGTVVLNVENKETLQNTVEILSGKNTRD
jgi:[acyl-carrier-protein] S-malonyltransferase